MPFSRTALPLVAVCLGLLALAGCASSWNSPNAKEQLQTLHLGQPTKLKGWPDYTITYQGTRESYYGNLYQAKLKLKNDITGKVVEHRWVDLHMMLDFKPGYIKVMEIYEPQCVIMVAQPNFE